MTDIAALKKKVDVVSLIGSRVELKRKGDGFWACCPFHGDNTPSLKLDDRQGDWLWKCFGCGEGGDVITFIEKFDHISQKDAIDMLVDLVGDDPKQNPNAEWRKGAKEVQKNFTSIDSETLGKPKRTFTLAQFEPACKALMNCPAALAYLTDVRGLNMETIQAMKLGYVQKHIYRIDEKHEDARDKGWISIPRIEGEKVVGVKFRSIVAKTFSQVNNMDGRSCFNIEASNPLEPVYVTEGEFDACVLEMAGFRAVSLPSAGVDISTESRLKLKLAPRIFLAGDNDGVDANGKDKAGVKYMKKLLREFGENTHWLVWPEGKDANDFYRDTCERSLDKFRQQVVMLSKKAKDALPEGYIHIVEALRSSDGTDMLNDPDRLHMPPALGYADRMTFTPRGGVCILFSTYSGTGKSMLKSQILLHEAKRGEIVVDLSPEIRDNEYLALVTSQTVGPEVPGGLRRTGKMDKQYFLKAADMLDTQTQRGTDFRYYVGHNVIGDDADSVLEFLENTIRTLGATRFAVDTFHRLIFSDKNQAQAEGTMAKKLEALGNKYGTIFMLVCQSNAEAESIDNLKRNEHGTLRGSRELKDVASSIYLLHRNRRPQKDGENPEDVLEREAGLYAKKTRYKGPGFPQCKLLLQEENSLFVEGGSPANDPGPSEAPPPDDGFSSPDIY